MADTLRLLFELDTDPDRAIANFKRARVEFAREIATIRKLLTQPFQLPSIRPPTSPTLLRQPSARGGQADDHVKEFRRIEAEAAKSVKVQEREQARLNRTVQSLQRQRSAAIIAGLKAEERAAVTSARAQERAAQQASRAISNAFRGIGPGLQSIGRTLSIGITAPLLALGVASLKSAKDLDANVNTLKAFTGSAEAAERRLAELIKTARGTPGLTTNLALTLDAQLRVAQTTQETIDRVLPAIGRMNAASKLPDVGRFTQNLLQLVTQNFERQDLKELVGQSPVAGQLITEIFNVDSPTNAKAIREQAKKLGLTTVDAFFNAFAEAAQRNQGLATVTESIGTRFDKVVDRVTVALRPLGLSILKVIEPFVEPIARLIERIGSAFDSLSEPVKAAIVVIAGIAATAGPVLFVLGSLATGITAVVSAIGTIGAAVAAVGLPALAAVIAGLVIVIGEWVVILGVLGLAWKNNFLNIRGLVTGAASAVLQAFNRIKAVIHEATERILPTLQSVTTKVLAVVSAAWDKYGKDVIAIISVAFNFATRIVEGFLRTFGDVIDLLLKLIDGDFRGAWNAFSRIIVNALTNWRDFLDSLGAAAVRAFTRLMIFIASQAIAISKVGHDLASRFVAALAAEIIKGFPTIRDAVTEMFVQAARGFEPGTAVAIILAKFIDAIKKGAKVRVPVTIVPVAETGPTVGADVGGDAFRKKPTKTSPDVTDKGADAATRRRIRLLELEADKVRTLTDAQLAHEQIAFDERKKSLEDYTNAQIKAAGDVLLAQLAIYAKEREEAKKIRNQSARDLALAEIGQKEFEAQQAFSTKVAQLEATRRKAEFDAERAHRQALLDLNEQADEAELARLEDLQRRGSVTAFDVANRQAEIEKAARARQRAELELQLKEADQNKEDRKKILDELKQFDAESAEATEEAERRKRQALEETVEAYNVYARAIIEAQAQAAALIREASIIQLESLRRRVGDRRRILREQLRIEEEAARAGHEANKRSIDDEEKAAIEAAKKAGDIERRRAEIEKQFHDLRLAEDERFNAERKANQEELQRSLDPLGPLKDRWDELREVVQNANDAIADSVRGVAQTISDSFDSMVDALRQGVVAWILYGESLGKALKKALAEQLANLAVEFAIQALKHAAYALGSLAFGNFAGAAKHAAATAAFAAAAAATGFGARSLAKSAGLFKANQTTASAAANGGDPAPRNATFNSGRPPVESASRAAQEGSGGIFGRLAGRIEALQQQNLDLQRQQQLHNAQVAQALTKLGTARPGDVVTVGASDARQAIAVAVIDHSNSSGDFNEALQRNLGFA